MTIPAKNLAIGQSIVTGNTDMVGFPATSFCFASYFPCKLFAAGNIKVVMGALAALTLPPGSFPSFSSDFSREWHFVSPH